LLDPAPPELAECGVDEGLVEPQHPLGLFPGERPEPLGVAAEAGEDYGEVLRFHLGEGRQRSPVGNPRPRRAIYVSTTARPGRSETRSRPDAGPSRSSGSIRS